MLIVGHGNLPITGFYLTDEECKYADGVLTPFRQLSFLSN